MVDPRSLSSPVHPRLLAADTRAPSLHLPPHFALPQDHRAGQRMNKLGGDRDVNMFVKCEFFNPLSSVSCCSHERACALSLSLCLCLCLRLRLSL